MADILGYNRDVERFRDAEFPMLQDALYLDHAGTTLYSKSLMEKFTRDMTTNLLGNPHSLSLSSQLSSSRVEDVRLRLLNFFGADPAEFDLVFVSNATAAIKLIADAMRSMPGGFAHAYHQAAHTSIVGIREEARTSRCLDDEAVEKWISGESLFGPDEDVTELPLLFSYTAQSHMDGKRYPLSLTDRARRAASRHTRESYVLLDAASYVSTSPLDLSQEATAPDFAVTSLYKIFGFPDLGALIVRRSAESVFRHRKYFGGGTVDMVICGEEESHVRRSRYVHEQLEEGTLPFHSILALDSALDVYREQFGTMSAVSSHTSYLRRRLFKGLSALRHHNGRPVCVLYSQNSPPSDEPGAGPVVAFNLKTSTDEWVSLVEFEKLACLKKVHVRTGAVCCPGGIASTLGLTPLEIRRNFSSGVRCGGLHDVVGGKPTGIIRASLGPMSIGSDVDRFVQFISEFYCDSAPVPPLSMPSPADSTAQSARLEVKDITVYPIKSCGGFHIPPGTPWQVKPEGLAWDREWCLIHQGSGQALGQKRYPRMALIKPVVDFHSDLLRVSYRGDRHDDLPDEIAIPLSGSARKSDTSDFRVMPSRVCGDAIIAQTYTSPEITHFFSAVLGVPCLLARFPAGGRGQAKRSAKTGPSPSHATRRSNTKSLCVPGSFRCGPPTPPESDSEPAAPILLSNESPILLIHTPSVASLNDALPSPKEPIPPAQFRANIVVGPISGTQALPAFSEESWSSIAVTKDGGKKSSVFRVLGKCYRCQMVCVDQEAGVRGEEPFVTLARTRRVDGKVPFGVHVCLETNGSTGEDSWPWVRVGDNVAVDIGA